MEEHTMSFTENVVYICDHCGIKFLTEVDLAHHLASVRSIKDRAQLKTRREKCIKKKISRIHEKEMELPQLLCEHCGQIYVNSPYCLSCNKNTPPEKNIKNNAVSQLQSHLYETGIGLCEYCGKIFTGTNFKFHTCVVGQTAKQTQFESRQLEPGHLDMDRSQNTSTKNASCKSEPYDEDIQQYYESAKNESCESGRFDKRFQKYLSPKKRWCECGSYDMDRQQSASVENTSFELELYDEDTQLYYTSEESPSCESKRYDNKFHKYSPSKRRCKQRLYDVNDQQSTSVGNTSFELELYDEDTQQYMSGQENADDTSDDENNNSYQCDHCVNSYKTCNDLLEHLKVHVFERRCVVELNKLNVDNFKVPTKYETEPICNNPDTERLRTKYEYGENYNTFTSDNKQHLYMKTHVERRKYEVKLGDENPYDLCEIKFTLKRPSFLACKGKDMSDNKCDFCQKILSSKANLERHIRIHTGERPYKCEYCKRRFSDKANMRKHMHRVHNALPKPMNRKCKYCERVCKTGAALVKHQRFCLNFKKKIKYY